jgi:putative copper resistance protein D
MPISLLICSRMFHFGSGMILVGVVAFRWLILLPGSAGATDETWQKFTPLFRKLHALFMGAGAVLIVSGFGLFWAVAAGMSGTSLTECLTGDTLGTVLFQTRFGSVCQWRLGFAVILGVLMWRLTRDQWLIRRKLSLLEMAAGSIATALVVSMAWTGHAAASGGSDIGWKILADATHLLAASIWPTGLLPFAIFLGCARRIDDLSRLRPVLAVTHRFSTISFVIVGLLILTGIINSYFIVESFPALVTTDYGRLLCLKLSLFLVILGIAACNRYRLLPLLSARADVADKTAVLRLLHHLQGFVMTEFLLAAAIVVVISVLGITPPPH